MKIAVQGCGNWGKNWVRVLGDIIGEENVVKVDPNVDGCIPEVPYDEVDAVVIATPSSSHCHLGLLALWAGKHVMIEKPMALTCADAIDLVGMANHKNVVLMTNHIMLVHPAYRKIKARLPFGSINALRAVRHGSKQRSEGVIWNLAPHDLSMAFDLMGEPLSLDRHDSTLIATWQNAIGVFDYEADTEKRREFYVFSGPSHFSLVDNELSFFGEHIPCDDDEPLRLMAEAFIRSCKSGVAEVSSGESALPIIRLLEEVTS